MPDHQEAEKGFVGLVVDVRCGAIGQAGYPKIVNSSWTIGRAAGIDIRAHVTFMLLLVRATVAQYLRLRSWSEAFGDLGFIVVLFLIVLLHETGHALVARPFGIRTLNITLLPIWGVARLERMPDDPKQEMLVALAGPAVNLVLAGQLFGAVQAGARLAYPPRAAQWSFPQGSVSVKSMWADVFLAVFIAVFVWIGAARESEFARVRWTLSGGLAGDLIIEDFRVLSPDNTYEEVADRVLAGHQLDFPVIVDGKVVGVLTRDDLTTGGKGGNDGMRQELDASRRALGRGV